LAVDDRRVHRFAGTTPSAARRWIAMAVAIAAAEALFDLAGRSGHHRQGAVSHVSSLSRILMWLVAVSLLGLAPRLWRETGRAVPLVISALLALSLLDLLGGASERELILESGLVAALLGWMAFELRTELVAAPPAHAQAHDLATVHGLVKSHGDDSLAPFILRPDKRFHLTSAGALAYGVMGRTAVVSGDPVGPPDGAGAVVSSFQQVAAAARWRIVVYGASRRHLDVYRDLGFRVLCVGEEAVVDPSRFTLEGRRVRKLRQSVNRVARHGWEIQPYEGREIDSALEAEIESVERAWRARQRRLFGFTMGMGAFEDGVAPADIYILARAPDGRLLAVMRFISHRGKLSLDTMRRVGVTPNGLNEAMVCCALEEARERRLREVSLNYAGLAHLVRHGPEGGWLRRLTIRMALPLLSRHFQMHKLVRFNQKFDPTWRPRYLAYESRLGLPLSILRVLQAEGYLGSRRRELP
jgi:lysyl-tRNA synthetase class 2